jgi:hypothetical protein
VTVTLNATDAGSGVAETLYCVDGGTWLPYTAPVSVDADGKHTVSFYSKDRAGNTETAKPVLVWIDETPPVITIASPEPKTYIINEVVLAAFSATDATSGVATCEGTVPNGQPIDTAAPCSVTLEVTAHDFADNSAEQSVPYQITYGVMALYDQTKAHRPVGTVAIKIRLVDAAGANLSSPQIVVHAERVVRISDSAPGALEAPGDSNPDLNFRYDAALGGYLFNLKLSGYATGTYRLHFSVPGDPVDHTVEFQVK